MKGRHYPKPDSLIHIRFHTCTRHQTVIRDTEFTISNHRTVEQFYDNIMEGYWVKEDLFVPREKIESISIT